MTSLTMSRPSIGATQTVAQALAEKAECRTGVVGLCKALMERARRMAAFAGDLARSPIVPVGELVEANVLVAMLDSRAGRTTSDSAWPSVGVESECYAPNLDATEAPFLTSSWPRE